MLKIGLTGGIGSGKTTVAKVFELLYVPVYYADDASKMLYHSNPELKKQMKEHFGADIYTEDNLNRNKLAALVFNDPLKLQLLNQLVHPLTIEDARMWMEKQNSPYAIKEAALLFESGSANTLDYIIGVQSPEQLKIKRVMERDHVTKDEVLSRSKRQMNDEEKIKRCDFIIINDERQMVIPQVLDLHKHLLQIAG